MLFYEYVGRINQV